MSQIFILGYGTSRGVRNFGIGISKVSKMYNRSTKVVPNSCWGKVHECRYKKGI